MALSNAQYEAIFREYQAKQNKNRYLLESRLEKVYDTVPGYQELDASIASLSAEYTKRIIDGEPDARKELSSALQMRAKQKQHLLMVHGYPSDYLEPIYDCPDCKDSGYIGFDKCHCFKQRIIEFLYQQSGIKELLQKENFSTLSYQYFSGEHLDKYKKTVHICKEFVDTFDEVTRNLLLIGNVGTGKSFLSNCIAKALIDSGHSVIYFSAIDLFDTLSKNVFDKTKENLYSFTNDLYNCDLVIVDDLGTELTNSFVSSYLFAFLNGRNMQGKSTLISTNLTFKELGERYSERTISRIISNFDIIETVGSDIRKQSKL
ncbi:MAG: DNA replication protein DnaC [Lachnospiraceae bacterium]|nr:DNA replication protein DnaC [Lachnospiraceae bacterium]